MDKLIRLREALASKEGQLIMEYCKDFMVEISGWNAANAEWIKGIGMLLRDLESVPEKCEREHAKQAQQ